MINVTQPFTPPYEEYVAILEKIWQNNWYTNNGPFLQKLETDLKKHLELSGLLYTSNGTIAIQMALKALGITKEVITTPFSYVATTSSIVWEGATPVFVDIDENSWNLNPALIEAAITENTQAIVATHCFGNPCEINQIEQIAQKHNLKVIYDAAHCFGTKYQAKSVFAFGDISTTSFHATKLFHTVEGGAVFSKNKAIVEKMAFLRNFGHDGPEQFNGVGVNGKNSELHAAAGIVNLRHIKSILAARKAQSLAYDELLNLSVLKKQKITAHTQYNYAYYPVVFENEETMLRVKNRLERNNIFPRRYFFPSLNQLDYIKTQAMPVSESIAGRILCLPLYHTLEKVNIEVISHLINEEL